MTTRTAGTRGRRSAAGVPARLAAGGLLAVSLGLAGCDYGGGGVNAEETGQEDASEEGAEEVEDGVARGAED